MPDHLKLIAVRNNTDPISPKESSGSLNPDQVVNRTRSTRILLVTSFFEEEVDYQEVQIARVLTRKGFQVTVLCSDRSNYYKKKRIRDDPRDFEIVRLNHLIRVRNTVWPLQRIQETVDRVGPQVVFLIHPGSGLSYYTLDRLKANTQVVSFFGDLSIKDKTSTATGLKGNLLVQRLLKNHWYRRVFEHSEVIVANTNETAGILEGISKFDLRRKLVMPGLGYDPQVYYIDSKLGQDWRKSMQIGDDKVVIATVTRIFEGKPIDQWIQPVVKALAQNPQLVYVLAGFTPTPYSTVVKQRLLSMHLGDRLRLLDFTNSEYNNKMYNGADYSLWFIPTISIQQSMATGLSVILPKDHTLDHLIETNRNGLYYNSYGQLETILSNLSRPRQDRNSIATHNTKFSYEVILASIIGSLDGRRAHSISTR